MSLPFVNIVDFLLEHHPYARTWESEALGDWVATFHRHELIICSTSDGENINGIVMFRLVMDPKDALLNDYAFDPEGACVFLDFTAGTPEVRSDLIVAVIQRVGKRPVVAWERRGTLRIYDIERFLRHNLKEEEQNYGWTKSTEL